MRLPDLATVALLAAVALLPAGCGARSALTDDGAGGGGSSDVSSSGQATTASSAGGVTCTSRLLGVDGEGATRLELSGDTLVYGSVSGNLVRADLGSIAADDPPRETVIARGVRAGSDVAVFDDHVYFVAQADFGVVVKRVPLAGGVEEHLFFPEGSPAALEVDASGLYVADSATFTGRVVRVAHDGSITLLADQLGKSYPIAIAGDTLLGFADTLAPASSVGILYAVPKKGGVPQLIASGQLGVEYAHLIDGVLYWYRYSTASPGAADLFTYDATTQALTQRQALPDGAVGLGHDATRNYVTVVADPGASTNVIYATDRDGAVVGKLLDGHPERFPSEIRAGGGRVAWTVQRRPGIEGDVPSVQVECAGAFR